MGRQMGRQMGHQDLNDHQGTGEGKHLLLSVVDTGEELRLGEKIIRT